MEEYPNFRSLFSLCGWLLLMMDCSVFYLEFESCLDVYNSGFTTDGVYKLKNMGYNYCVMSSLGECSGAGWTLVMKTHGTKVNKRNLMNFMTFWKVIQYVVISKHGEWDCFYYCNTRGINPKQKGSAWLRVLVKHFLVKHLLLYIFFKRDITTLVSRTTIVNRMC